MGEHKAITAEQQFLGLILCFFSAFKMAVAIVFLRENAVEAISITLFSVNVPLC